MLLCQPYHTLIGKMGQANSKLTVLQILVGFEPTTYISTTNKCLRAKSLEITQGAIQFLHIIIIITNCTSHFNQQVALAVTKLQAILGKPHKKPQWS